MTGDSDDAEQYLFVVDYDDDAERKRVEYLFNNWTGEGTIENPAGLVRTARDVAHDDLYEQLVSKVPADSVETFRLDPATPDVTPATEVVEQSVAATEDAVESFVEYMLSKKKAVVQSAAHNEYEVYTNKGRADVQYQLQSTEESIRVRITIEGQPPAPSFLQDYFETELTEYAATNHQDND